MAVDYRAIVRVDVSLDGPNHHVYVRVILQIEIQHDHDLLVIDLQLANLADPAHRIEVVAFRDHKTAPDEQGDHDQGGSEGDAESLTHAVRLLRSGSYAQDNSPAMCRIS